MNDSQRARFTRWLNTTAASIPHPIRVKALDWLVGSRSARATMRGTNLQMELDLADALQVNMYLDLYWDRKLSNWLAFFAGRGRVFADIGAHVGYFTLLMSYYGGSDAVVHAFEPNPYSFEKLKRNATLNELHVVANSLAVTQSSDTLPLRVPHRFLSGATRMGAMMHTREIVYVQTMTLDDYCQRRNLPGFDLVKMDIEGAETKAIPGMELGLRRGDYKVLLIELHASLMPLPEAQGLYQQLQYAGYQMYYVLLDRLSPGTQARPGSDYHVCALSPRAYAELGSPPGDFHLPQEARLPFPIGVD